MMHIREVEGINDKSYAQVLTRVPYGSELPAILAPCENIPSQPCAHCPTYFRLDVPQT